VSNISQILYKYASKSSATIFIFGLNKKAFDVLINPIEYGRGHISALSFSSNTTAREVHILRIRNIFDRAGIINKLKYTLSVLSLMRELQNLGRGYWFPVPVRIVPIPKGGILLGILSTNEFRTKFPDVKSAGYARVIGESIENNLPRQDLDNWLGLDVPNSISWSKSQITLAQENMSSALPKINIQFLGSANTKKYSKYPSNPIWTDNNKAAIVLEKGVVFCREHITGNIFRYFIGQLQGAKVVAEAEVRCDLIRFQYGFAALADKPFCITLEGKTGDKIFHVPAWLPRPERQLMLALGVRERSLLEKAYRVTGEEFNMLIIERLHRLGCTVRSTRV